MTGVLEKRGSAGRRAPSRYAVTAVAFSMSIAPSLHAQTEPTITLPAAGWVFQRSPLPARRSEFKPNWINHADCVADETLTFPLTLTNYVGYVLEAWVGPSGCGNTSTPAGENPSCWLVYRTPRPALDNGTLSAPIRARNIIGAQISPVPGEPRSVPVAPASVCDTTVGPPQSLAIDFMLVDGTTIKSQIAEWTDLGFDVTPPDPPTDVVARAGDTRLTLGWTPSDSGDVYQYDFFCQPTSATEPPRYYDASGGGPLLDAAMPTNADGGADAGRRSICAPTVLVPGSDPGSQNFAQYACGSVSDPSAVAGAASGLTDNVPYVVTVSSTDSLQNVGPLSETACATPVQLTDFFGVYRQSGGGGGGGLCSIATPVNRASNPMVSVSTGVVLCLARRRRRSAARRARGPAP